MFLFEKLLGFLLLVLPLLIAVAFLTLAERKVMGSMQQRRGPNTVGFHGLLQPIADAVKLMVKESVVPTNASTFSFVLAPILTLFLSLCSWAVIPFSTRAMFVDIDLGLLFVFALSSLTVYGVIISGWSSNSRYAFFGAIRSSAQMISYEICLGLILVAILVCIGNLNFVSIVTFQSFVFFIIPLFPLFLMFLVSILAETNRAPFDLPEAESELVSGFNVEYSSMGFALFFLAEYSSMILMSALAVITFLGGWLLILNGFIVLDSIFFALKISVLLFFYIWARASFPRFRIDQLMRLCWKIFLPLSLGFVLIVISFLFSFNGIF